MLMEVIQVIIKVIVINIIFHFIKFPYICFPSHINILCVILKHIMNKSWSGLLSYLKFLIIRNPE
jgi:hypothetical protein